MHRYIRGKRNTYIYFVNYLLINIVVLILGIFYMTCNNDFCIKDVKIWECIGLIIFIMGTFIWLKIEKNILSAWLIFYTLSYIYWFGQTFLHLFGILPPLAELYQFTNLSLCVALVYQCIGFGLMHLGAIYYKTKHMGNLQQIVTIKKFGDKNLKKAVNIVAVTMFLCSAPYVFINLYKEIIMSIRYGYLALYENIEVTNGIVGSLNNIVSSLKMFFVPSLFLLLAANKDNKKVRMLINSIFMLYICGSLISGGRSVGMGLAICLMLFYHIQIKPYRRKRILLIVFLAILFLILVPLIGELRGLSNRNSADFFTSIGEIIKEDNIFVSTFTSMGFSIFPMVKTMELIPKIQDFSYGIEYISTIFAIVPSILFFGYSFTSIAALPDWLRTMLNMDYGPGYSIIAESYYNFGWMGLPIMFLTGYIIQKFFSNKKSDSYRVLYDAQICIILYFLSLVIRNSILLLFRNIFYGIFIPMLIIKLIYNREMKGEK